MRVLKGFYKGTEIISPDVKDVRPTVDHFKKHILRLFEEKENSVVWDLFSGSGGVGLELLSAGAKVAVFVEQLNKSISCLKLNLSQAQLKNPHAYEAQEIQIIQSPAEAFLKNPKNFNVTQTPNFVFLDPPYGQSWMKKVTPLLLNCAACNRDTLFLAEHVNDDPLPDETNIVKQEIYGPKVLTCFKI